jgi:hypothetical protein
VTLRGALCNFLCRTYVPSEPVPSLGEPMFYKHDTEPIESLGYHLGEQLRERLRLALDFATLGAYELTAPEGDRELSGPEDDAPSPAVPDLHERERPQRVFLFAKAAPACPASRVAEQPRCAAAPEAPRTPGGRPRRRRGGVEPPEQPCLCAIRPKPRA